MGEIQSVDQLLKRGITELSLKYNKEEAESIMFWLLEELTPFSWSQLRLKHTELTCEVNLPKFEHMLTDLLKGKPVQYVVGKVKFRDLELKVNTSVLIPRPETEELVGIIVSENKQILNLNVLDVCTGSGCIAIALAKELKFAQVQAIDISPHALELARKNAELNNCMVTFVNADILNEDPVFKATIDLVVSNPPYVMEKEKVNMQDNVLSYEPAIALFVQDNDPLIFYRSIATKALHWLKSGGKLYFEINEQKGREISDLLTALGYQDVQVKKDIYDKERFVSAQYLWPS